MPITPNLLERTAMNTLNLVPGVMLDLGGALAFQTVSLAVELDLFATLAGGPQTAAELAAALNSHERGLESLLQALHAIGYLEERDGRYANSSLTKKWVLNEELFNFKASFSFWSAVFQQLSPQAMEVMQTGQRPYGNIYAWLEDNPHLSNAFQQQLMANATLTGPDIAKKLELPASATKVLDLGGGHGLFSINLCQQYPHVEATIVDSAIALETATVNIAKHNLSHRIHLQAGDLWQEGWGDEYDAILLFNLIHHFDEERNVELLHRCSKALKQGGQIAILDQIAGKVAGSMANAFIRLIALHYFLLADGRVYAHDDILDWFGQTGFQEVKFNRILKAPGTSLMVARKG